MAFIKLHASILDSSVWLEDDKTRIVWFTLMAMADRDGIVEASVPGLAHRARVPRRACERAIEIFMSPDVDSRTETDDGRRIEKVPGGWRLINYMPYREKDSVDDVREKNAERQRRFRVRHVTPTVTPVTLRNVTVTPGNASHAIGEGEAEEEGSPDLPPPDPIRRSAPDRAHACSENRADLTPGLAPIRPPRAPMAWDATLPFLECFDRYPRKDAKAKAACAWQATADTYPGGEVAMRDAILARFDAGMLKHHPYSGENRFRPLFEAFLAERRWEDPESAPDDAAPVKLAETFDQRDARARREKSARDAVALGDIGRRAREAEQAARQRLKAGGGA